MTLRIAVTGEVNAVVLETSAATQRRRMHCARAGQPRDVYRRSTYPRIHVYYREDLRTELTALHTPWVCQNLIRFCMVFDGRQRASAVRLHIPTPHPRTPAGRQTDRQF